MAMIEEYKRSLKLPQAEEIFDLLFFRPVAFVLVKTVYRLPVTPNQISLFSLITGLIASFFFSQGLPDAYLWAGIWYTIANILDCADGQLARLQNSGTLLGRVIDGIADYITGIAIFVGIGVGLQNSTEVVWMMVLLAGISTILHAVFFDHFQSEFITSSRGERIFLQYEIEKFTQEINRMQNESGNETKVFMLHLYLAYLRFQQRSTPRQDFHLADISLIQKRYSGTIRLWSYLGPSTNRTLLIFSAFIGRVDLYLYAVVFVGNAWLIICLLIQLIVNRRIGNKDRKTIKTDAAA